LAGLLEVEHAGEKGHGPIEIADGHPDVGHGAHRSRLGRCHAREEEERKAGGERLHAPSRAARWSPILRALAMIVSAGLTALDDGKNEPSTTYRLSSSCALQFVSRTDVFGSSPKRSVPFWCATPASGMRLPM